MASRLSRCWSRWSGQLASSGSRSGPHVAVGEAIVHGCAARCFVLYRSPRSCGSVPFLVVGSVLYGVLLDAQATAVASPPSLAAAPVLASSASSSRSGCMLSSPVASAEDVGPVAILRRSWELSKGNWWRLFVFLLLFGIGALCLLLGGRLGGGLAVRLSSDDLGRCRLGGLLVAIVSQLVSAALSVVFFVMLARIYAPGRPCRRSGQSVPSSGT